MQINKNPKKNLDKTGIICSFQGPSVLTSPYSANVQDDPSTQIDLLRSPCKEILNMRILLDLRRERTANVLSMRTYTRTLRRNKRRAGRGIRDWGGR